MNVAKMNEVINRSCLVTGARYLHDKKSVVLNVQEKVDATNELINFEVMLPLNMLLPNVTNLDSFSEEAMIQCTSSFCQNYIGKNINVESHIADDSKDK